MITRNKKKEMAEQQSNDTFQKVISEFGLKSAKELEEALKQSSRVAKSGTSGNSTQLESRSVRAMIPAFSAYKPKEDIRNYIKRLKYWIKSSHIDQEDIKDTVLTVVGEHAFEHLMAHFDEIDDVSVEDVFQALEACFGCSKSIWHERLIFEEIVQHQGESVADLISRIKLQAAKCKFSDMSERLTSKFLHAISDVKIKENLISRKELDFNSAINFALTSEERERTISGGSRNSERLIVNKVSKSCPRCGGSGHSREDCRFKNAKCFVCSKIGHVAKMCRAKHNEVRPEFGERKEDEIEKKTKNTFGVEILNADLNNNKKELVTLAIGKEKVDFQLDSGAETSIINRRQLNKINSELVIRKSEVIVKGINGRFLKVVGAVALKINKVILPLIVIEEKLKYPILGIDAMDALNPCWRKCFEPSKEVEVLHVAHENIVEEIVRDFKDVFDGSKMAKIKHFSVKLIKKKDASPIFKKNYEAPLALKKKMENELRRLEEAGIISQVEYSNWASPIIPVIKKNGDVRICGDFKKSINLVIEDDKYPLPLIEDILNNIGNYRIFTVLDLSNAYLQLELEESSKELTTVNTHIGLFKYNRLPFGVKTGPAKLQKVMDEILKGIEGSAAYMDDIVIAGINVSDCVSKTKKVLKKLNDFNVKVNFEKSNFFKEEIEYLGFRISKNGIKPSEKKLEAIVEAREPSNVTEVRAYLGMLNYYRKFIPNLSENLTKLHSLLAKESKFIWNQEHAEEFKKSKELLIRSKAIVAFDSSRRTVVAADASKTGIGAVLSQVVDGQERIVCCVSRTLSETEKRYPQIEKEALALIFAVRKFHKYLLGKRFELVTDHEPLRAIFSPNKKIPQFALNRLQHYALILQAYDFEIKFKKGSANSNADLLSRLPLDVESHEIEDDNLWVNVVALATVTTKMNLEDVRNSTNKDETLNRVKVFVENGFPMNTKDTTLKPFVNRKLEIHVLEGCLFWNNRLIIPFELRQNVLQVLHENHLGIVKCKQLARQEIWWPGIDLDIEKMCKDCEACNVHANRANVDAELSKWRSASRCFERVHIDFFSKYGLDYLIIVDAYSGWMDVRIVENLQAGNTIDVLRDFMATFGMMAIIVSDNGPTFTSWEFSEFCKNNRIRHYFSPAYHPQSNGLAERGVQTVKSSLKKIIFENHKKGEQISINRLLANFLFKYRNTPRSESGKSPADLVFNYRVLTDLRLLKTEEVAEEINVDEIKPKFKVNEMVWVLRTGKVRDGTGNWELGQIKKIVSQKLVEVDCSGKSKVCHIGQIRKRQFSKGGNVVFDNSDLSMTN